MQDEWKSNSLQRPPAGGENERQEESTDVLAAPAKKRRLANILSITTSSQDAKRLSIDERVTEKLSRYLGYNQPEINSSPFKWWKDHSKDLLYISILAKKYLSVCATSYISERVFSTSENIVTGKRNCLKPDKVRR